MPPVSHDTFFNGRLLIRQPAAGYRFSIDAVILARRVNPQPLDRILDLGTGCGVIPLILGFIHKTNRIFGVEIQKDLADIARLNAVDNDMAARIAILNQDIKTLSREDTDGRFDIIVCNPPHFATRSGRINPNAGRAIARHEIAMTLDDVIGVAVRMINRRGRVIIIYPAERMVDVMIKMRAALIEPKSLCMIHAKPGTTGMRMLLEGVYGGRPGLSVTPPLTLYNSDGSWSGEAQALYRCE